MCSSSSKNQRCWNRLGLKKMTPVKMHSFLLVLGKEGMYMPTWPLPLSTEGYMPTYFESLHHYAVLYKAVDNRAFYEI